MSSDHHPLTGSPGVDPGASPPPILVVGPEQLSSAATNRRADTILIVDARLVPDPKTLPTITEQLTAADFVVRLPTTNDSPDPKQPLSAGSVNTAEQAFGWILAAASLDQAALADVLERHLLAGTGLHSFTSGLSGWDAMRAFLQSRLHEQAEELDRRQNRDADVVWSGIHPIGSVPLPRFQFHVKSQVDQEHRRRSQDQITVRSSFWPSPAARPVEALNRREDESLAAICTTPEPLSSALDAVEHLALSWSKVSPGGLLALVADLGRHGSIDVLTELLLDGSRGRVLLEDIRSATIANTTLAYLSCRRLGPSIRGRNQQRTTEGDRRPIDPPARSVRSAGSREASDPDERMVFFLPTLKPHGGVIKVLDYLWHATELGCRTALYCPGGLEPDAEVLKIEHLTETLNSVAVVDSTSFEARATDRILFAWPPQYAEIRRLYADAYRPDHVVHLVQSTRHGNPEWLDGLGTELLAQPYRRIFIGPEVLDACLPYLNPRADSRTIIYGYNWEYFVRSRPETKPDRPLRVGYMTWKSDAGVAVEDALTLDERFEFRSLRRAVDWPTLRELYHWCDVLLGFPIREEGFYLVGLEAMAAGCILVMPDSGGNGSYAEWDRNCLQVGFDDVGSYVERLNEIVAAPQTQLTALRRAGYETINRYTPAAERQRFHQVLMELFEAPLPPPAPSIGSPTEISL